MFRFILSMLCILSFLKSGEIPTWFYTLKPNNTLSEVIGYGQAKNLEEAKIKAREDIAKQIKTIIDSTSIQSTSLSRDNIYSTYGKDIKEKTVAILQDIKLLKKYTNEDKEIFVALSYENIPFVKRIIKKFDLNTCKEKQNNYLKNTILLSKINKQTNCTLNIKLQRKDKLWYLIHKNSIQELPLSFFEELYISVVNPNINLKSSEKVLKDGDEFYFQVTPTKDGYISLLTVYEDGTVTVLLPNIKVKQNKIKQLPDENYGAVLEAGLIKKNQPTHDLYVAIYSKEILNLSRFEQASDDLSKGEDGKKFDELINRLDGYDFSTILIRTKPKL